MSEKTPITKENAVAEMHKVLDALQVAAEAAISFIDRVNNEKEVKDAVESNEDLMSRGARVLGMFEQTGGLL